jgi:hypothetical protein
MKNPLFAACSALLLMSLTASAQDTSCPPALRLTKNKPAQVVEGGANRIRSEPSVHGAQIGEIPPGGLAYVQDGPVCGDGYQWWKVGYNDIVGWTAEGEGGTYWVTPLIPITAANVRQLAPHTRLGWGVFTTGVRWSADGKLTASR